MNPDDTFLEKFHITQGSTTLCQPCLTLAFFAPELKGDEDMSGPLRVFDAHFGETIAWCRDKHDQMHPKPVSRDGWPKLREALFKRLQVGAKHGEVVELRSASSTRDEWLPPFFELSSDTAPHANLHLRVALPLAWLTSNGVPALEALIDEIVASGFPFKFGYAGIGLMWNRSSVQALGVLRQSFREWSSRHPGLIAVNPLAQIYPAAHGLVDVAWITLLGPDFAKTVGGAAALSASLHAEHTPQDISVRELSGGCLAVRAGAWPRLGDKLHGDRVELQRTVGRALRVLWNKDANPVQYLEGFDNSGDYSEHAVWANRFFD